MIFSELVDLAILIDNANPTQTDARWPRETYKKALNQAYQDELDLGIENGLGVFFRRYVDFTWPASQPNLSAPATLRGRLIEQIADITNNTPGAPLAFSFFGEGGGIYWLDNETLRWENNGPGSARTLRAHYMPAADTLVNDTDIPSLIPTQHHSLLAWSAVAWLRTIATQGIPTKMEEKLSEKRGRFWKMMTRGRPTSQVPSIRRDRGIGGPGPSVLGDVAPQDGSSLG